MKKILKAILQAIDMLIFLYYEYLGNRGNGNIILASVLFSMYTILIIGSILDRRWLISDMEKPVIAIMSLLTCLYMKYRYVGKEENFKEILYTHIDDSGYNITLMLIFVPIVIIIIINMVLY